MHILDHLVAQSALVEGGADGGRAHRLELVAGRCFQGHGTLQRVGRLQSDLGLFLHKVASEGADGADHLAQRSP